MSEVLLDDDEYGFEILKVQEIIGMMRVTPVPQTPSFVQGVINLRGKVIPIIDLRLKFAMPAVAQTEETCIIVVRAQGVAMGIVVDRVSEVLDIATEDIDALSCGAAVNTDYILGIGKATRTVTVLLDIDQILSTNEVVELRTTAVEE